MSNDGLDGRYRDENGEIHRKQGNTRVDTLRKTYGDEFASDYRGDTHLETLLEREGVDSLSEYIRRQRKR